MDGWRRRERAAARGDREAGFRLFMDRVGRGEVWVDARPLKGGELEDGDPDFEGDHLRMAGRPVLLIGYVALPGTTSVVLQEEDAALVVVDDVPPRRPDDPGEAPLWQGELVGPRPHRLLGDPNAVFFDGPLYDGMESAAHEVVGARRGEADLVARWLDESFGWPSPSWFEAALAVPAFRLPFLEGDRVRLRRDVSGMSRRHGVVEFPAGATGTVGKSESGYMPEVVVKFDRQFRSEGGSADMRWHAGRVQDLESDLEPIRPNVRNPILGPVERRESLEPPSCPACAASWERLRTRRGGFWFMCRRHAEEAGARRRAEAARRRVREIERSGDPGWVMDPDAED